MGHFNGTCGVTNLPVMEGERVVMIPLIVHAGDPDNEIAGSGLLENDRMASPIGLPIRGEYNGYGNIKPDAESVALEGLVSLLAAHAGDGRLVMRKDEGSRYAVRKKPLEAEALLEALQERRLAFKAFRQTPESFGGMFVREAVFDSLTQLAGKRMLTGFKTLSGHFIKKRHKASNQLEILLDIGRSMTEKELAVLREREEKCKGLMTAEHFQYLEANALLARKASFAMSLTSRAAKEKYVSRVITEFLLFADAFDMLRKNWHIQTGEGQSDLGTTGSYYKVVADAIYEALEAR